MNQSKVFVSLLSDDVIKGAERIGNSFHVERVREKKECTVENKTSPTRSFLPLIKRTGVKIKHMFSPEEEEERLKEIKENRRKRG